jgi:polyhydroxyalkanoate synthase
MYCWYMRNTYLENKLCEPGATTQCGVPVDLSSIRAPAFLYASKEDHIVPWKTAYTSAKVLSGDVTFVLGASGHIAGVINPPAKNKRNYWINKAAADDPDAWFDAAESIPGSWWPAWYAWLAPHSGPKVNARKNLGNVEFTPIEDAPGAYVKQKAP